MLTGRLSGGSVVTSRPRSRMRPPVGSSKPPIIRRVVVLPQPDGPSSEKNSPATDLERDAIDGPDLAEMLLQVEQLDLGGRRVRLGRHEARSLSAPAATRATMSRSPGRGWSYSVAIGADRCRHQRRAGLDRAAIRARAPSQPASKARPGSSRSMVSGAWSDGIGGPLRASRSISAATTRWPPRAR